MGRAIIAFS